MAAAPAKFLGAVTSSRTAVGQLGHAFGLAGGTALVGNLTRQGFISDLKDAGVPPTQYAAALDEVRTVVLTHETPATDRARELVSSAAGSYASAFNTTMLVATLLCLGAAATIALLLRRAPSAAAGESAARVEEAAPAAVSYSGRYMTWRPT